VPAARACTKSPRWLLAMSNAHLEDGNPAEGATRLREALAIYQRIGEQQRSQAVCIARLRPCGRCVTSAVWVAAVVHRRRLAAVVAWY